MDGDGLICDLWKVAIQLKIIISVGTAIIMVDEVK